MIEGEQRMDKLAAGAVGADALLAKLLALPSLVCGWKVETRAEFRLPMGEAAVIAKLAATILLEVLAELRRVSIVPYLSLLL